jgi:hypothetical protein
MTRYSSCGYSVDQCGIPCCPPLRLDTVCDSLDFDYRLIHKIHVDKVREFGGDVEVEVKIRVHIELCSGALALGDLVYSTTLLPGEKVRLFTSDRRNRFTFNRETQRHERNEQTSEEHFYLTSISDFLSDVTVRDAKHANNTAKCTSDTHVQISDFLEDIFGSPSIDIKGSHDAYSTREFLRELAQHVRASDRRAEVASRGASAVSIGEVHTREHADGQSEDQFESSSREFANPNKCHAVTFFFYRVNKIQTLKVTLESIECRAINPVVDTKVTHNSPTSDENRPQAGPGAAIPAGIPNTVEIRKLAQLQVEQSLAEVGLLVRTESTNSISPQLREHFCFERQFSLPTPGIIVKGCLDDCNVCECEPRRYQEYRCRDEDKGYCPDRDYAYHHERGYPYSYRYERDYSRCHERDYSRCHDRDYSRCRDQDQSCRDRERPYHHDRERSDCHDRDQSPCRDRDSSCGDKG